MGVFEDRRVLIIGGTGSLGRALVARLLSGAEGVPRRIVVMSRDETKQHDMRVSYLRNGADTDDLIYHNFERLLTFRIGDVRRFSDVCAALADVDVVVFAAAMKQVPTCEYFPEQALATNCLGALNVTRAILERGLPIEAVVATSTDKACEPANVMGLTKALQERIFVAANLTRPATRFVVVRYGNILASRGSVIPLFAEQIRKGGPVTVTHAEMTRFLLPLEQAVDTISAALAQARAGEVFVSPAPSAKVMHIAAAMIDGGSIPIVLTQARPGEKMHEVVISREERRRTIHRGGYFVIQPMLPELRSDDWAVRDPDEALTSENPVLSLEETAGLLRSHGLIPATAPT